MKELYVRTNGKIIYIDKFNDFLKILEKDTTAKIGYHDFSIEFVYDGHFLYPCDRDDLDYEFKFSDKDDLNNQLLKYGKEQWVAFSKKLKAVPISDSPLK